MPQRLQSVYKWLGERLPLAQVQEAARHKTVPVHRYTVFYYLGGMTLFFFLVQIMTGILLMLYYRPSAGEAFESVAFISTTVPFGWLIRSIHSWSANLMIFFAFVHLATVFFTKSYRSPRELTWITGCVALFLVLGFGFSGYLLPWNKLAYFATAVGTDIAGQVPVIGTWLLRFLRGGDRISGGTLSRFYGWHVAILPAIATLMVGLHVLLVQLHGMSVPPGAEKEARERRPLPFIPSFLLRDLFGWTLALGVLAALAAFLPWELGEKADPFSSAPADIRPEWYFMFMFQTLKVVPGGEIFGISYEVFPILFFGVAGGFLVAVPLLDRSAENRKTSNAFSALGIVGVLYILAMTIWGYHSLIPLYIVIGAALLTWGLAAVTRGGARS